jgi:hypothetical protein
MDLGFKSDPNMHRAQKWPNQSADRSRAIVGGAGRDFWKDWQRRESVYVLWTAILQSERHKKSERRIENGKMLFAARGCMPPNRTSSKERSSTELRFASFPARL